MALSFEPSWRGGEERERVEYGIKGEASVSGVMMLQMNSVIKGLGESWRFESHRKMVGKNGISGTI